MDICSRFGFSFSNMDNHKMSLNIIFNILFTPIQFGLQNNVLALIDILLVVGTLIWAMKVVYKKQGKTKTNAAYNEQKVKDGDGATNLP